MDFVENNEGFLTHPFRFLISATGQAFPGIPLLQTTTSNKVPDVIIFLKAI
jgi:hypothetical protein